MPDHRTLHLIGMSNSHLDLANLADSRLDLAPNMVDKSKTLEPDIIVRPKNLGSNIVSKPKMLRFDN